MVRDVEIRGSIIRLGQLLKLVGVIDSGAEVKALLSTEQVRVNGEQEDRRGRQLSLGDLIQIGGQEFRLVPARPGAR